MEYQIGDSYDDQAVRQVARLHIQSLGYRSFITLFGETFLTRLYRAILLEKNGFFVLAQEGSRLQAFAFGLMDSKKLNQVILKRSWLFIPLIIKKVFVQPSLIKKLFETLTYAKKEQDGVAAELMVIAVEESKRSQGIGQELLKRLESEFKGRGINDYKVTAHKEMNRSIHFYQENGFTSHGTFNLYGHDWGIYHKRI